MSAQLTPKPIEPAAEAPQDGAAAAKKHHHKHERARNTIPLIVWDVYVDATFTGPHIIYTPTGETTHFSLQIIRATQDTSGSGPTTFDFFGNGMYQYLYIPYIQATNQTPSTYPNTAVAVQTDGVASTGSPPKLDPSPLFYKTFSVTVLESLGLAFRHRSFSPGSATAPSTYIPDACAFRFRSPGTQYEILLQMHNLPGQSGAVDFVWRKINTCCNSSGICPLGTACGPEDLLLQSM